MVKALFFRVLRFIGVLALIYVSMVFYLAMTERRNAFPRAIFHKEANAAISGKAKGLSCTLNDGTLLGGWMLGKEKAPILLYYPDSDEDGAQFLAEIDSMPNVTLVTFNYRGSVENKGTPSQETYESDAKQIAECAAQVNKFGVSYIAGRGTGSILAAQQALTKNNSARLILIDPVFSIADAIADKYRVLYPRFLIRADVKVSEEQLQSIQSRAFVVYDRLQLKARTEKNLNKLNPSKIVFREGNPLRDVVQKNLQ